MSQVQVILNLQGYQNYIIDSKVKVILLNEWILPIAGIALRRVSACIPAKQACFPLIRRKTWIQQTLIIWTNANSSTNNMKCPLY